MQGETQNYVLAEFDKTNENFSIYYKSQGIVKDDEWDAFIAALKDDLPTSFRIQGSSKYVFPIAHFQFPTIYCNRTAHQQKFIKLH